MPLLPLSRWTLPLSALFFSSFCLAQATEVQPPPNQPPPKPGISRGLLMKSGERVIFSPCRERTYVNFQDDSDKAELTRVLTQFGFAENRPIYVEIVGTAEAGTLAAKSLNFAHRSARCQPSANPDQAWRAVGENPDWSLVLTADQVFFHARPAEPRQRDGYTVEQADAEHLRIRVPADANTVWQLSRGTCQTTAEGPLLGWTITGEVAGKTYSGCAWQGFESVRP